MEDHNVKYFSNMKAVNVLDIQHLLQEYILYHCHYYYYYFFFVCEIFIYFDRSSMESKPSTGNGSDIA